MPRRINFSIAILSASIIAFQLVLIQILEFTQWYHFAYMVISIAMLGFGASGTFIALFRKWLHNNFKFLLPLFSIISGITTIISLYLSQTDLISFDTFLVFTSGKEIVKLVIVYLLFFLPFFFGAVVIGMTFSFNPERIGKLYFANMLGSGLGGVFGLFLTMILTPVQIVTILSFFSIIAGIIIIPQKHKFILTIISIVSISLLWIFMLNPVKLNISQFKSLKKVLDLPNSEIIANKYNQYGNLQVVKSEFLRYAPALSLNYRGKIPKTDAVFLNGDYTGSILTTQILNENNVIEYTTSALAFKLQNPQKLLIINSGAGEYIAYAISKNIKHIKAVESNKSLMNYYEERINHFDNNVHLIISNSRAFLEKDSNHYDLIQFPDVNSFGGNSGINSLKENYLFTKESFQVIYNKLKKDGMINITCWFDYPSRYPLRTFSSLVECINNTAILNPENHIIAVKSWATISFILKKSVFTNEEREKAELFCNENGFDLLYFPIKAETIQIQNNIIQDTLLFSYFNSILSDRKQSFYDNYLFNVKPITDNKPFFNQFLRFSSFSYFIENLGNINAPFVEIGSVFLFFTLIQIIILAVILIILPLFKLGWKGNNKLRTFIYFSGIGVGYMFFEIVLIQKSIVYFDQPIISTAIVLCILLIFSGIGSYYSSNIKLKKKSFFIVIALISLYLMFLTISLGSILNASIIFTPAVKTFIFLILIAPSAFFMGMPFPMGIKLLSQNNDKIIPWAWGINGCFSVISTALATFIAITSGFIMVFFIAILAYIVSLFAFR